MCHAILKWSHKETIHSWSIPLIHRRCYCEQVKVHPRMTVQCQLAWQIPNWLLCLSKWNIRQQFHLPPDVYQGKNVTNAYVKHEAWKLLTMQKVVVNTVLCNRLANDPDGMCEIYMDNHYHAPSLFILLREKYQILACGTICNNRKGLGWKVMNISKWFHGVLLWQSMTKQINC